MLLPQKQKRKDPRLFLICAILLILPIISIAYARNDDRNEGFEQKEVAKAIEKEEGLKIKSIDTQIVSKHWGKVDRDNIRKQIKIVKSLGANYAAVSTPYDRPEIMKLWVEEIHLQGMNVWFRSHWLNWEGDENHPANMTVKEYLEKTSGFIKSNPSLFKENDAFTVCVEPEQVFTARGTDVYDWYSYNKFILDQMSVADDSFAEIKLGGKIKTNWISMNGWVVDNALEDETVEKLGLITIDHYSDQKFSVPAKTLAKQMSDDLDRFHEKWQKPIILGEWGYNIEREVPDYEQREVLAETLNALKDKNYLVGFNYWAHLGNSSRLIDDTYGTDYKLRPAAAILRDYFNLKR